MTTQTETQAQKIARLNDAFRKTGKTFLTPWVQSLNNPFGLVLKVREFSDFHENNDPYGEHDFGKVAYDGQDFFWKIDYYDNSLEYGSDNPSDPSVTTRVLTIMHTSEY